MDASVKTNYKNSIVIEGYDISQCLEYLDNTFKAIEKIDSSKYAEVESVTITFEALVSPSVLPIGLTDDFWLSVALETYV